MGCSWWYQRLVTLLQRPKFWWIEVGSRETENQYELPWLRDNNQRHKNDRYGNIPKRGEPLPLLTCKLFPVAKNAILRRLWPRVEIQGKKSKQAHYQEVTGKLFNRLEARGYHEKSIRGIFSEAAMRIDNKTSTAPTTRWYNDTSDAGRWSFLCLDYHPQGVQIETIQRSYEKTCNTKNKIQRRLLKTRHRKRWHPKDLPTHRSIRSPKEPTWSTHRFEALSSTGTAGLHHPWQGSTVR